MNELRKINIVYINKDIIPLNRNGKISLQKDTKKLKKSPKKTIITPSERDEFKVAFSNYIMYNLAYFTGKDYIEYLDRDNDNYHITKNYNKPTLKANHPFDKLKVLSCYYILKYIDENFFKVSKNIRRFYKYNGYKMKKIDSDEYIYNLATSYMKDINKEKRNRNSLLDIYVISNYMIDEINYDYLNDFHIHIDEDIDELRYKYSTKPDLKVPKYLNVKRGKGRKKFYELAFKLVTVSEEITCNIPRRKYLDYCDTKEDFLFVYKSLGKGIRRYMKYYSISPLFEVFVEAIRESKIINIFGYSNCSENVLIGVAAILFAAIIMNTSGIRKGALDMVDSPTESSADSSTFHYNFKNKFYTNILVK